MTSTQTFPITGLTCGHCVAAVTEEVSSLPGVGAVRVDLQPSATSTLSVTSDAPLSDDQVATALDEAGDYHLAGRS